MRMNGLYPCVATAPGRNAFRGKPLGPGTATRRGAKFGAPWKWITAGPKWLAVGEGLASVTVWMQPLHPIPALASLGA